MRYDVVIIGSGPSGLTAGIYLARANLKTLIIGGTKWGGQLMLTTVVENYPGFPEGIEGPLLMSNMRKQAEKLGCAFLQEDLKSSDFSKRPFILKTATGIYEAKAVIIATGADNRWLNIQGEKERIGHGVSSCAPCDAPFFRNKKVIVVGGGDSAMEEALVVSGFAEKVIIVHRGDAFRASKIMQDRVFNNKKISVMFNSEITQILGENKVSSVMIKNNKTQEVSKLDVDGVFVAIGHLPNTLVFDGIQKDEEGFIIREEKSKTSIEGIFVSGDVSDKVYKQAVTAAGLGCMAALDVQKWLENN